MVHRHPSVDLLNLQVRRDDGIRFNHSQSKNTTNSAGSVCQEKSNIFTFRIFSRILVKILPAMFVGCEVDGFAKM